MVPQDRDALTIMANDDDLAEPAADPGLTELVAQSAIVCSG